MARASLSRPSSERFRLRLVASTRMSSSGVSAALKAREQEELERVLGQRGERHYGA